MKDMFPIAALLGGVACIIMGHAFAGVILCFASLWVYESENDRKGDSK